MQVVKATAVVKAGSQPGSGSGSAKAAGSAAGSKAGSAASENKNKGAEDSDAMVTIEETFTRKVSFPVRKGESVKYGVRESSRGGGKGFYLGC